MSPEVRYVCAACGEECIDLDFDQAIDEAVTAFSREELCDADVVCNPCWRRMRESMPEFDSRYE